LHPFDSDIGVTESSPHRFDATISGRWNGLGSGPLGGYVLAVGVRAMEEEMTHPDPLSVSAIFMRQTQEGEVQIATETMRHGSRLGNCEARLHQHGRETLRILATFTDLDKSQGRVLLLNEAPPLTPPDDSLEPFPVGGAPALEIAEHIEYRLPEPIGWYEGAPAGKSCVHFWMRFREPRMYDAPALALFADAAAPIVFELGETESKTLDMSLHLRSRPAEGWLACRVSTRHIARGFHEEDFEIWDSRGMLVAQSRQLAVLPRAVLPDGPASEPDRSGLER